MYDIHFQEVKSIHGLQMYSAAFTRLLLNKKMLDACEDIMETPNILLHHTKAHLKPPGSGSPFPMHQVLRLRSFVLKEMLLFMMKICHISHSK